MPPALAARPARRSSANPITLIVQPERDAVDPVGDVGQPLRAEAGELPEDGGVDLVDEPAGAFGRHRDHGQDQQHAGGDEPRGAGRADAARQRRGRTGGAPAPAAAAGGRRAGDDVDRASARGTSSTVMGPARRRANAWRWTRTESGAVRPGVEAAQRRRCPACATPRRASSTRRGAEPVDRVAAHDRRDVLGRLQRAVVDQLDEVVGADRPGRC